MNAFLQGLFFWLSVIAILFLAPAFIYHGHESTGWALMLAGVITMLATRFDEVSEISFGTFTAKLQAKIKEANEIIDKLRLLSAVNGKILNSIIIRSGRLGSYTDTEKETLFTEIEELLRQQGLSENEILKSQNDIHQATYFDYGLWALGGNRILPGVTAEFNDEYHRLRSGGIQNAPSPRQIEDFFRRANLFTPERQEILRDYEHYVAHKRHRRPQVWARRGELRNDN